MSVLLDFLSDEIFFERFKLFVVFDKVLQSLFPFLIQSDDQLLSLSNSDELSDDAVRATTTPCWEPPQTNRLSGQEVAPTVQLCVFGCFDELCNSILQHANCIAFDFPSQKVAESSFLSNLNLISKYLTKCRWLMSLYLSRRRTNRRPYFNAAPKSSEDLVLKIVKIDKILNNNFYFKKRKQFRNLTEWATINNN